MTEKFRQKLLQRCNDAIEEQSQALALAEKRYRQGIYNWEHVWRAERILDGMKRAHDKIAIGEILEADAEISAIYNDIEARGTDLITAAWDYDKYINLTGYYDPERYE